MVLRRALLMAMLCVIARGGLSADESVNPHWTGMHCLECHTDKQGGALQYGGDAILLCNRCHVSESAPADPHPVGVMPPEAMRKTMPSSWPLQDGTVTCLTCHDALLQMHDNPFPQLFNPSFLRGGPAAPEGGFCFTCHDKKEYRKENPHQQLDAAGLIMEKACLSCHRTVPVADQDRESAMGSLRAEAERLCASCHGDKNTDHPVRGNHLVSVPDTMQEIQKQKMTGQGVYLPLLSNRVSCVTCHNPHQRGVLKMSGAAAGAGETHFLRLKPGKELCTYCHQDIQVPVETARLRQNVLPAAKPEGIIQHKPYREEKCKACHAIDGYEGENRPSPLRCFGEGCHETPLIRNTVVHDAPVLGSCSFCHTPHNSGYEKLLLTDENTLCATCHPLLRGKDDAPLREADHERLTAYASSNLLIPPGYECHFCHNPAHKSDLQVISTDQCGACHLYLGKEVSSNGHQQYADRVCSACHHAHASSHEYLLKEPLETYRR